ncbi:MAG: EFR1 family ferrodoxin [Deltaproteobacteria bacterium]|nr:EFR1 family ferrodoxin [Deltaproteobacteria bacterium]
MDNRRDFLKKSALVSAGLAVPALSSCACLDTIRAKVPMKTRQVNSALVVWYSQTGNTRRYGRLMAKTMQKQGVKVTACDLREADLGKIGEYDLLVVGSPVFYYDAPEYVQQWVGSLPVLAGMPVAAYVSFGGPEGNQYNAACSILERLVQKQGVPVAQKAFMNLGSYPLSWAGDKINKTPWKHHSLPDRQTYGQVREYARYVLQQVAKGQPAEFSKKLTLREISTYFGPIWWTKRSIEKHYLMEDQCIACGTCEEKCPSGAIDLADYSVNREACVLCFGCLNNCPAQAVYMQYDGTRLIGFQEFLKAKKIKILEPAELKS